MYLYDYLLTNYGYDNPILVSDIQIDDYTQNDIKQLLSLLEKQKKIKCYSDGIYYIARETIFGQSQITFESVIEKIYIQNGQTIYGYYTGIYFKNLLGLTTQIVNTPEIVSNKEFSKRKMVELCGRNVIVRKSDVEITNDNVKILQFFDLFKYLTFEEVEKYRDILDRYINATHFTKDMVIQYLPSYSEKVAKLIIKSGLIYEFI